MPAVRHLRLLFCFALAAFAVATETAYAQRSTPAPPVAKEFNTDGTKQDTSAPSKDSRVAASTIKKLEPLHTELGKPKPGDWLD